MAFDAQHSLRKRNAALELIDGFRRVLVSSRSEPDIRAATLCARQQALELQGAPADRPYLRKTVSQLGTALRRAGWLAICVDLLEWAIAQQIEDSFLYTELGMCHLGMDDVEEAERVLARAEACGMTGEAMYASLVAAWGRAGRPAEAQRIFDRAQAVGVCAQFAHTALMDSYVRAGDLSRARDVFAAAQAAGCLDTGAYAVLLRAYIRAGYAAEIARLGRQADDAGYLTDGLRSTVTQVLHRAGRSRQANRFRRRGGSPVAIRPADAGGGRMSGQP